VGNHGLGRYLYHFYGRATVPAHTDRWMQVVTGLQPSLHVSDFNICSVCLFEKKRTVKDTSLSRLSRLAT